jgi:hypothetical protein
VKIQIDEDMKYFYDKFRVQGSQRFPREEFVSFDVFKKLNDGMENSFSLRSSIESLGGTSSNGGNSINTSPVHNRSKFGRSITMDVINLANVQEDYYFVPDSVNYSETYQKSLIEDFIKQIYSIHEVEVEIMGKVMEILYNNNQFAKSLVDTIFTCKKAQFHNVHNLQHLANILNTISLNLDHTGHENYELNFGIIYLAGVIYYTADTKYFNKIYLCSLLSKNKLYSTRSFWLDLIEYKLISRVQTTLHHTEVKILSTDVKDNILGNFGNKLKNLFGNEKEKDSKEREKDTPIISYLLSKSIEIAKIYERLPANKRYLADKIVLIKLNEIIKEFITYFANFNYDPSEAIDLIVEISTKYKVTKDKISYFVTMLNSYMFSIKNSNFIKKKTKKPLPSLQKPVEFKTQLFLLGLNYLPHADIVNVLCTNKAITSKISKKVYKRLLNSGITLKQRLEIWQSLLNIVNISLIL